MQALKVLGEKFFLSDVIKFGISAGSLAPAALNDILNGQLPSFAQTVFQVKNIKFTDPQKNNQAIKDILITASFGMECKVGESYEDGVKLLLHKDGGISWCYKKGNTELLKLKEAAEKINKSSKIFCAGLNPFPGLNKQGKSELNLLSHDEQTEIDILKTEARPTWPFWHHLEGFIYSMKEHKAYQSLLETMAKKIAFVKGLKLDSVLNADHIRSLTTYGAIGEPFEIICASLMLNLANSDFKEENYTVTLDDLDKFRSKFCDFVDKNYYLKAETLDSWLDWLRCFAQKHKLSKEVFCYVSDVWSTNIVEKIAQALAEKKYYIGNEKVGGNISSIFMLPLGVNLEDRRLKVDIMVKKGIEADVSMGEMLEDYEGILTSQFLGLNEEERLRQLDLNSVRTVAGMFSCLSEEHKDYNLVAYYLNLMNETKAIDVFLQMERIGVEYIYMSEDYARKLITVTPAKEIYQVWTWDAVAKFNDFHVRNIFKSINKELQEAIMKVYHQQAQEA